MHVGPICHTLREMRLAPLAIQLGFLLTSYVLGVATGRQEAVQAAPIPERVPVAGSTPDAPSAAPQGGGADVVREIGRAHV